MKKRLLIVLVCTCVHLNAQFQTSKSNFSANYFDNLVEDNIKFEPQNSSLFIYKSVVLDSTFSDNLKQIKMTHEKMKSNKSTAIITTILAGVTFLAGLGQKTKKRDSGDVLADTLQRSTDKLIGNILIGSSVAIAAVSVPFYYNTVKYKRQRNKLIALEKEDKETILEKIK
ncbi:MAG: hypothetical protein V3U80_09770 [Flavobacteriaceae bacterium]